MLTVASSLTRRFQVADGMILVAATSMGLAAARLVAPHWDFGSGSWGLLHRFGYGLLNAVKGMTPMIQCWTIGVLAMRLRNPRPRWQRLRREPGFVACLASSLNIALVALWLPFAYRHGWGAGLFVRIFLAESYHLPGLIVGGAWWTLAITGLWRSERDWVDLAGRLLGATWIMVSTLGYLAVAAMTFALQ